MTSVTSLEDEARKRKERLRALREKHTGRQDGSHSAMDCDSETKQKLPRPVFRSYKPQDEKLKEDSMQVDMKRPDVSDKVKDQLEAGKSKHMIEEVDLLNLAPRKPDWDLKRDIAPKLEKLDRHTQRAIAELIRERLKASQEDLACVVNASDLMARVDAEDAD
ncbi:coiled-coil domain-containing protein 12-like [Gigantopelta aegis]|uniref:coiled-coil domain-containing protein 12-like n=1 Tax=Gigantopelta aegis TaxID=1735272 RepID=UPI001B88E15E|nr:coiled-coil domain-containing protein 12-like [Gigantopelta aegis]